MPIDRKLVSVSEASSFVRQIVTRELFVLVYQADPIRYLLPGGRAGALSGAELLWRGSQEEELSHRDEQLLRALAAPRLDATLHLNIHGSHLLQLPDDVLAAAARAHRLVLEWIEPRCEVTRCPRHQRSVGQRLAEWRRAYGIQVALDDWDDEDPRLEAIPDGPDQLKLDGALFRRIAAGDERMAFKVARRAEEVAHQVPGLMRVAEWVERWSELAVAAELHADAVQGHLFPGTLLYLPTPESTSTIPGEEKI